MKRIPQHLKDFLKDIATKSSHSLLQSRIGFIVDATNECENLVIDSRRALANVTGLLIEIAHSLGAKKQYAKQNKFTFSGSRHHQRQSGNLKESYQGRSERTNIPFDGRSRAFTRAMTDMESRMSDIPDPWKGLVGCVINRTGDENDMLNMFQNKYILVSSAHLLTELSMLKNLTASDLSAEKIATLRIKFSDFFKTIHPSSSAPIRQKVLQVCNSSLEIIENWEKNINSSIETDKSLVWTTLNENLRELRLLSYGEINGSFMLDERLDECLGDLDRPTANVLNPARESHAPDDANERSKSHFYRLLSNSSSLMNSIEANWRKIEEFFKLLNDYQT
uniref:Uncharacterized protein n=1 Tax=Plectus sambesii TaxID=2011161 RepID=A0A914XCK4_9BILA